jgi:hypothetical protein
MRFGYTERANLLEKTVVSFTPVAPAERDWPERGSRYDQE